MATEQDCIDALLEAADRLGESPSRNQYQQLDISPSVATIQRHCSGWNAAKEQAGLDTVPASGGLSIEPKPAYVDLPEGTTWAELTQDQRWHYRYPERNTERSLARRNRLRAWVRTLKTERGCTNCNESDARCLDFHHRDGTDKDRAVSRLVANGCSKSRIRAEVAKCDVLCANCHRVEHYTTPPGLDWAHLVHESQLGVPTSEAYLCRPSELRDQQRAWVHEYKCRRGCQRCGCADGSCLVFHHRNADQKTDTVSNLIAQSVGWCDLLDEIDKCSVLCANCHRRLHSDHSELDA